MSVYDKLQDAGTSLTVAIVGAAGSSVVWLVRRIFTNQQQIELLSREIAHRDQLRQMDRADITEVKDSVKRIEGVLLDRRQ